jgi:competence protein ComEA
MFSLMLASTVYAMHFNKNIIEKKALGQGEVMSRQENKIYLNKATVESLKQLKGIGSKRAKDIVTFRNAHGLFQTIDDLVLVKGFNKKFIQRLIKKNESYEILV